MKNLLYLLLFLPAVGFAQGFEVDQNALGTDSLWVTYINPGAGIKIVGKIYNDNFLQPFDGSGAGSGSSRTILIRFEKLNDDTVSSAKYNLCRIWASTTAYGQPAKLSLVTIGDLTGTTYSFGLGGMWTQAWSPEIQLETVRTDASGQITFTVTSTGIAGLTDQFINIEIQGIVYSFSFQMFNSAV